MEFLGFHLYGPMAAWGATAVGEYRPSHDHPTRSAIVGLLAACLGIRRDEEERQIQLYTSLRLGVLVLSHGSLLRDYHSIQVPSRQKTPYYTRKEELSAVDVNTLLSSRDYRMDALYRIALWHGEQSNVDFGELEAALQNPFFSPYLGRKSCPASLPFAPCRIETDSLSDALLQTSHPLQEKLADLMPEGMQDSYTLYHDACDDPSLRPVKQFQMKDRLLSRQRWQFGDRTVFVSSMEGKDVL